MNLIRFISALTEAIVITCERCGEAAVIRQCWVDWDRRIFLALYACGRCGHMDWFAMHPDEEAQEEPPKKGMDNGYL